MRRGILTFSALLSGIAVIATSILVTMVAYRDFYAAIQKEVMAQSSYVQTGIELMGDDYLREVEHASGHRLTIVASDGTVLLDTVSDPAAMDNHGNRPEIQAALEAGFGESTRYSDTLREQTYYYAVRLADGSVLRMSSTTNSLVASFDNLFWLVALIAAGVFIAAFIIASLVTKRIVRPINEIDLEHPEREVTYDELVPLLGRIKAQNDQIHNQIQALDRQRTELASITENMSEGFLLLDRDADVLTYNRSALRLLNIPDRDVVGQNILMLNRSEPFRDAVGAASRGAARECITEIGGRYCQILVSPVVDGEQVSGAVLILVDITERHSRDQLRREFTANVSHELKTPLTAISGYAEIIMNGIARQEDIRGFSADIYKEAQRLIALVRDLMLLSKLDEADVPLAMEPVDLLRLSEDVAGRLRAEAEARDITLSVTGEPAEVMGVPSVLDEMVYNLLDNAIKYNRDAGRVSLQVERAEAEAVLTIADTGIGISKTEQYRVFERFYRVDKSHSGDIPGTGLGLAIVKHGASLHGAKVQLESVPGSGTTVTIRFPYPQREASPV